MTQVNDFVKGQEEQNSHNREPSRRSVFNFSMVDIPIGSELTILKDKNKVSRLTGDREIEFEETMSSLNQITIGLLKSDIGKN